MKASLYFILCFLISSVLLSSNLEKTNPLNWKHNLSGSKMFIENKGQLDNIAGVGGKALFSINNPKEQIVFTNLGVNYVYLVPQKAKKHPLRIFKNEEEKEREEKELLGNIKVSTISMQWKGSNPNVEVVAEDLQKELFYCRKISSSEPYKCLGYKKITYKNLYPSIDVVYTFDEKIGYKYTIIVHPGADASKICMSYSNNSKLLSDKNGGVLITSNNGTIMDYAPVSYIANTNSPIVSSFVFKKNNCVEFALGDYDHSKELIIDPLTISPGFTTVNKAYDVARNPLNGDLFVYGGYPPYEVKKFNSLGTLIWTYATSTFNMMDLTFYGDMAIDPSGDVYLSNGCCENDIIKLNGTSLSIIWTTTAPEPWRLVFDKINNRLIVGGYVDLSNGYNVKSLNASNGALVNFNTIISTFSGAEVRAMTMTPAGNLLMLHVSGFASSNNNNNSISSNSPSLVNQFVVSSNYNLDEVGASYAISNYPDPICVTSECFHGINALAANNSSFYTYDGNIVYKRNINSGIALANATVTGSVAQEVSGIAVDSCGSVYVGTKTSIVKYDSSLTYISTNTFGQEVYDIIAGANSEIIACGDGFLSSYSYPCSSYYVTAASTSVTCSGSCNGTATANIFGGIPPFTYHWSNGANTQTISNLCSGNYTVVVKDATGDSTLNQVTVTSPLPITVHINSINTPCNASIGFVQADVFGGNGIYSYMWSPIGSLQDSVNNLQAGTYIITVTDGNGCSNKDTAIITEVYPSLSLSNTTINCYGECTGTSSALVSLGSTPYTFAWSGGEVSQIITGLCAGNYTCVVTDFYGCKDTAYTSVSQSSNMILTSTIKRCEDEQLNAEASVSVSGGTPGYSYLWDLSPLYTSPTITGIGPGSYVVVVKDSLNCSKSFEVIVPECPNDSINIPNVFTPNGDGVNDVFSIYNTGYTSLHCEIFNRWGIKVYEWNYLTGGWNGKINETEAADGVYFFVLKATKYNGAIIDTKGFLHLIKR